MRRLRLLPLTAVLAALALTAGCGGGEDALVVYSGREEALIGPLLDRFEAETGITTKVAYADSSSQAAKLVEEGDGTPADVFVAQDSGALGAVADAGRLAPLAPGQLDKVAAGFRDAEGEWVGLSGRSRVIAYPTDRLSERDVPNSVLDVVDPRFRDRVGFAPSNASFQAFVTGMRLSLGDDRTRAWLDALTANGAKRYENNLAQLDGLLRGEIDLALVNHYYLYQKRRELGADVKLANKFLGNGDPGALVNVAGAGVVAGSDRPAEAARLIDYLLATGAQEYFRDQTDEYPLADGVQPLPDLPPLDSLQAPDIDLNRLGGELAATQRMLTEAGLLG